MAALNIDVTNVPIDTGRGEPVPAGWYYAMIRKSEMKPTNDGSGAYLELEHEIVHGQYAGRTVYGRLNLRNNNPKAQEIAYKQLSAIGHAVNVLQIADSVQLHDKALKMRLSLKPERKEVDPITKQETGKVYGASNEIEAWTSTQDEKAVVGAAPAAQAPAPVAPPAIPAGMVVTQPPQFAPQAQQPAGAAPGAMPWAGAAPGAGAPTFAAPAPAAAPAMPPGMPAPGALPPGAVPAAAPAGFAPPFQGAAPPMAAPAAGGATPPWMPRA